MREKFPDDAPREVRMAIIGGGAVRMAHLAIVGRHTTNGVAELHTELLKAASSATSTSSGRSASPRDHGVTQRAGC